MPEIDPKHLITNLRYQRAWVMVAEVYLRQDFKPDEATFLADLLEVEQAAVEQLARELRLRDVAPGSVEADEALVAEAQQRRTASRRMQFIQVGLARSLAWYETRLADAADPDHALWQSLHDALSPLVQRAQRFDV